MKKHLFSLALFMAALKLFGQADPPTYGYNYQAVIRDDKGQIAVNQPVHLRFQILNSTNQNLYEETHATTTDVFGGVALVLGSGMAIFGKFDTLNWGAQKHFLDMAIKMNGVADWADLGRKEVVLQPTTKGAGNWLLNGQDVYRLDGKVGIGTFKPTRSMHIASKDNYAILKLERTGDNAGATYLGGSALGFHIGHFSDPINETGYKFDFLVSPQGYLHLNGNARIYFQTGPTDPNYFIESYPIPGSAGMRVKGHGGVTLTTAVGDILHVVQDRVGIGMGTSLPQAKLHVNGDIRGKIIIVEGSDRTHRFNTTTGTQLPAGTVVVFDETQPGKIRPCAKAYDRNIPGIVSDESGKGKYHPGIIHEQEDTKNGSPVALDGTVEAFAVGPIAIGDYLTTSKVPGHAMRTKNRRKSEGAEIGRALTPLAKGVRGKVEVFVGRD